MAGWDYSITYIQWSDLFRKFACIFAGLGHLQPLLLATTNSHYLLDRFCMERCCSSEYVSRIVTSLIFMEILAIIIVRIVLYIVMRDSSNQPDAANLVSWTRHKEEPIRDYISIIILWVIFLGYIQILCAFTSGGKKGHMHWFYASLLIQHFLNSLIAGSIGFWEVGRALWYLVTLPMAPITVFFYQLYIHSWIRNNGPRDAEYIIVENQIQLALLLSGIATLSWTLGYLIPHIPCTTTTLNLASSDNPGDGITTKDRTKLKVYTVDLSKQTENLTISAKEPGTPVTIHSITVNLTGGIAPIIVRPNREVTLTTTVPKITVSKSDNTVTVKIEKTGSAVDALYNGPGTNVTNVKIALEVASSDLGKIAGGSASETEVKGYTYTSKNGYYISSITGALGWNEEWDGGRCLFAAYYKSNDNSKELICLHVIGNTLKTKYYGKESSGWKIIDSNVFYEKLDLLQRTGSFTIGAAEGKDAEDPSYNTEFTKVLCDGWKWWPWEWNWNPSNWTHTPIKYPLVMQGLSVGAVGSIFPNLIPKTLTCPKTSRTLTVINMFLVPLPHIFNVALAENDCLLPANPWADWDKNTVWPFSLLLYLIYALAILFAIFNIHYPEWALSIFLRNNTLMVFLMILFTDVLNETFNAISRAGICSQRSAKEVGGQKARNHPFSRVWN